MRYAAFTAIFLAVTAVAASPAQRVARDAAETPCTEGDIPAVTQYHQEYVTVTRPAAVKTTTIRRKKHKTHQSPQPTAEPVPTYEPMPTYEPEPVPSPTEPESKPTGAPVEPGSYSEQCLQAHNTRRAQHSAPDLVWDEELANYAKGVSSTCVFQHSGGPYGENLAAGGDGTPEDFIKMWYDEKDLYNYGSGGFSVRSPPWTRMFPAH